MLVLTMVRGNIVAENGKLLCDRKINNSRVSKKELAILLTLFLFIGR